MGGIIIQYYQSVAAVNSSSHSSWPRAEVRLW